jgi:hypothetical protein
MVGVVKTVMGIALELGHFQARVERREKREEDAKGSATEVHLRPGTCLVVLEQTGLKRR